MKILLEMIKMELEGETAGLEADMTHFSAGLIDFIPEEARKDPNDAMNFLDQIATEITQWEEDYSKDEDHPTPIVKMPDALPPKKEAEKLEVESSKTQERCTEPQRQTLWKGLPPLSN